MKTLKEKIEKIARFAHEVNRAYCKSIGDDSQPSWKDAPDWQKESAMKGVEFKMNNLDATPENMHDSWSEQKVKDGWIYGVVKDPITKTHPCLVPYDSLPVEQRTKDYLFSAVVNCFTHK
jgi:hypothetical protein